MPARTFGKCLTSTPQVIVGVVDDDPGVRKAMATLLSAHGYGTETFDSAEAFLEAAATSEVTCVLVDIHLGDISGVELARELAAAGFKYPIIFMSGDGNERIRNQAAAAGGVAFLSKPFPEKLLIEAIMKATGQIGDAGTSKVL
jgi:FixJ family two-component response regulator